jgi:hypothetical protein
MTTPAQRAAARRRDRTWKMRRLAERLGGIARRSGGTFSREDFRRHLDPGELGMFEQALGMALEMRLLRLRTTGRFEAYPERDLSALPIEDLL